MLILISATVFAQNLTATFDNAQIVNDGTFDWYEVEVYLTSDVAYKQGRGQFYLFYDVNAFGNSIATPDANGARVELVANSGSILAQTFAGAFPVYNDFIISNNGVPDGDLATISLAFQQSIGGDAFSDNVLTTPTLLGLVRMRYENASIAPEVCFNTVGTNFDDQFQTACGGNPFPDCSGAPGETILDYDGSDCSGALLPGGANCASTTTFTIDGDWDNGDPDSTTEAIIAENYDTSLGNITACELVVQNGATLTINAGDFAEIEGNITVDMGGAIVIAHQGSLVQVDDMAIVTNNGSIEVQVTTPTLKPRDFMIMGSPMSTETRDGVYENAFRVFEHSTTNFLPHPDVEDFYLPNTVVNFMDDNFNDWLTYSGTINPAEGYLVSPQADIEDGNTTYDLSYTNGTLNNGIITYDMEFTIDQNSSPSMLANPYPSAINADLFIQANDEIDEIYFWEHITEPNTTFPGGNSINFSMEDISMYNLAGGVGSGTAAINGGTTPNGIIATSQGFGIKASAAGTATFNNSMRVTEGNTTLRNSQLNRDRIWLQIENQTYNLSTETLIAFTPNASLGFDAGYDSEQIGKFVSLFSRIPNEDKAFAIQSREAFNNQITISLGFSTLIEDTETYTISLSNFDGDAIANETIYLNDHATGIITNLSEGSYTFTEVYGVHNDRFTLQFINEEVLDSTENVATSISVFPNPTNGIINIQSPNVLIQDVYLVDIQGRIMLQQNNIQNNTYKLDMSTLDTAVYFITIITEHGSVIERVIKE